MIDPALKPYPDSIADQAPVLSKNLESLLVKTRETAAATSPPELPVSIPVQTLRRDLVELGPILHFTVASDHHTPEGWIRVYRVEGQDMVEFYTVKYGADAKILDLDLLREF